MSNGFLTRRGAYTEMYAIIGVTYPEGAVCSCTDGSSTFTAGDTTGKALFQIPSAGSWMVSCTNGTETDSENVVLSTLNDFALVNLTFAPDEVDIFNGSDGGDNAGITGGWAKAGSSQGGWTFGANEIYFHFSADLWHGPYAHMVYTKNKIDVTLYSKIYITTSRVCGDTASAALLNTPTINSSGYSGSGDPVKAATISSAGTVVLDVSQLTGSYHLAISFILDHYYGTYDFKVTGIRMER